MRIVIGSALAAALLAPPLAAQAPTALPTVLRLPASARYLGLGNAGVASRDDDVLFYNPAQLVQVRGTSFSAQRYWPGNTTGAFSTVLAFWGGGLGVGAQWLGYSTNATGVPVSTASLDSAGTLTASSMVATLGFGRAFKGVRFGLSTKLAQESAPSARSTAGFVDLGAHKDTRFASYSFALQNVGTFGVSRTLEPARATLGAMTELALAQYIKGASPFVDIGLASQVSVLEDGWIKPAGGVELTYNWISGYALTARGGARRPEPGERPLTVGATLTADRIRFDYALETREGDNLSHRIGVRVR
jgi:hypothetical protein